MSIVTSYSVLSLNNRLNPPAGNAGVSSSWSTSWGVTPEVPRPISSAGWQYYAASNGVLELLTSGTNMGAWPGNANDQGIDDGSLLVSGTNVGAWLGNANGSTMYLIPADEHNDSIITADNPESNQSAALVEWNHFPFPAATPPLATKPRDMSRFQKSYSFMRTQPVRIRLFRR